MAITLDELLKHAHATEPLREEMVPQWQARLDRIAQTLGDHWFDTLAQGFVENLRQPPGSPVANSAAALATVRAIRGDIRERSKNPDSPDQMPADPAALLNYLLDPPRRGVRPA